MPTANDNHLTTPANADSQIESAPEIPPQEVEYALIMKGGGVKGLACIGALKELQRFYKFDLFVGTSAGAIIAALLGAGYTAAEMEDILIEKNFSDFLVERLAVIPNLIFFGGLFKGQALTDWLDHLLATKLKSKVRVEFRHLPELVPVF